MKIGDAVQWADVPSGALVAHGQVLYVRVGDGGWCVGDIRFTKQCCSLFGHYSDDDPSTPWRWEPEPQSVTIVALGLTGGETKETLSMLVRHFEDSKP